MSDSIPPEVVEQLRRFNEALTTLEDTYQKHFSNSLEESAQVPYYFHKHPLCIHNIQVDYLSNC